MDSTAPAASTPKAMYWIGWVLGLLPCLMLLASAFAKFAQPENVVDGMTKIGWPVAVLVVLGCLELGSTILYPIPQTAVLGAILLTGYLGGATATHVRVGEYLHSMAPVGLGVALWLGLFLRDARIRQLVPIRS